MVSPIISERTPTAIGRGMTAIFTTLGLITAVSILLFTGFHLNDVFDLIGYWIRDSMVESIGFLAGLYGWGYWMGGVLGGMVIKEKKSPVLLGVMTLTIVLLVGILSGGLANLLFRGENWMGVHDFVDAMLGVLVIGIVPTLILGAVMGWRIKKVGEKRELFTTPHHE